MEVPPLKRKADEMEKDTVTNLNQKISHKRAKITPGKGYYHIRDTEANMKSNFFHSL